MTKVDRVFDGGRLFAALDERRTEEGLTWSKVARAVWDLSAGLNAARPGDHPFSTSSITRLATTRRIGCQHALLLVWWLDATPEDFITNADPATTGVPLPACDADHRLRWQLEGLYTSLNTERADTGATWTKIAVALGCSPSQVTGLRSASYATSMHLAMAITQLLHRPATDFIRAASW